MPMFPILVRNLLLLVTKGSLGFPFDTTLSFSIVLVISVISRYFCTLLASGQTGYGEHETEE